MGEPTRLVLRDFNNDSLLDIAVNAPDEGKLLIYLGDRKGGFSLPAIEIQGLPGNFALDAGDFKGDGNLDIVNSSLTGPMQPNGSHVFILLGSGTGAFVQSTELQTSPLPTSVKVGDLNHDGKLDFVLAGAQAGNTTGDFISTYLGDGTGSATLKQTVALGAGNLKGEIALGDFNEDGKLDVAFPKTGNQIPHMHSTELLIFFGDGTGNLVAGPVLTVGQEPHTVITADFNKDGHLDLAVSNRTDATVSLLLGDGTGNFTVSTTKSVISDSLNP